MEEAGYLTVKGSHTFETVIERSRFIAACRNVQTEVEAAEFIAQVSRQHRQATHNCYAYILGRSDNVMRFSDDGEPSRTAGMPILEAIRGRKLYNTAVIVTRYFGGIKLGTGGLVRAYGDCAARVLDECGTCEFLLSQKIKIKLSYADYSFCEKLIDQYCSVLSLDYMDFVEITAVCKEDKATEFCNKLSDTTNGRAVICTLETLYHIF